MQIGNFLKHIHRYDTALAPRSYCKIEGFRDLRHIIAGFLELLGNPAELALRLRAEAAPGEFLHAVGDGPHQQLAAEVSGRLSLVETTPLLTKFSDIEREEARERLLIDNVPVGGLTDRG